MLRLPDGKRLGLFWNIYLNGPQHSFQDLALFYSLVSYGDTAVVIGCSVQKYKTLDCASASTKLNGELMRDDASKRPAKKVIGSGGIERLEPDCIAFCHAAN